MQIREKIFLTSPKKAVSNSQMWNVFALIPIVGRQTGFVRKWKRSPKYFAVTSFKKLCRGKIESGEIVFSRENRRFCRFFGTFDSRPKPGTCRCTEYFQENI